MDRTSHYMVQATYYFLPGTFYAKESGPLKDGEDRPMYFETKKDAEEFLTEIEGYRCYNEEKGLYQVPGTYYLSHGEYEAPDFKIVKRSRKYWELCINMSIKENALDFAHRQY